MAADEGQELEQCVNAFLELRSNSPGVALEARADLTAPIKELDNRYWDQVQQTISAAVQSSSDQLTFTLDQRLLLDLGLLDGRLLGGDVPSFTAQAVKELTQQTSADHFYFSQWLLERLKTHMTLAKPALPSNAPGPRFELAPLAKKLTDARIRIYSSLVPFLRDLPGVPPQVVESLITGRIDATINDLTLMGGHASPPLLEKLVKLADVRREILQKAKGRCSSDQQFVLFDALRQVDEKMEDEVAKVVPTMIASNMMGDARLDAAAKEERAKVLVDEAHLVKALLRLGTMGVGITRTHSVLLTDQERMTKEVLTKIFSHVRELDPHLPVIPGVMIAPYCGTGLYAWDKDTIIVPLISLKSFEESAVSAVASCRIMIDTMNNQGRLRDQYESTFPGSEFRRDFARDYRNWVLGVGKGFRGAMETPQYEFFKQHVGPTEDELFAPAGMTRLTPDERTELVKYCRRRINRGESNFQDYYRLAILYWREGRYTDALDLMTIAVRQNPADGRAVFSLGFMHKKMRHPEQAKIAFTDVAHIARNTVWHVYALEQLGTL